MEQHGKVSGRQKQLLKIGVTEDHFSQSLASSAWYPVFLESQSQQGHTDQTPQDWQIDLGNYCNSACIFCTPHSSSRLATEFRQLGLIDQMPPRSWCDDPAQLESFIRSLTQCSRLVYLHFIGGETLITPAFARILQALIDYKLHQQITIGFTTNLTVWDPDTVDLLSKFQQVNLGMSIECLHPLNDYVRYGSSLNDVNSIMQQWLGVARENSWLVQLRTTPTVLTVWHLHTVYDFAWRHGLAIESCNFLDRPEFMRPSVLPQPLRQQVIQRLRQWMDSRPPVQHQRLINGRDPNQYQQQLLQDINSYVNYLDAQPDESHRLPDLVGYLRRLESSRGNRILDYLPEYESILRSAGY